MNNYFTQDSKFPAVDRVSHAFVTVNGHQLHIAETGNGKPLLLLHGWPQHWYVWRKLIPLLSQKYKLIMPDLPGFGWSEVPKDFDYNKEQLASEVLALLDVLKLKQVGLIGHDWGGWIGFLACLREPKRFSAFLALGILHPFKKVDSGIFQLWRCFYQIVLATPFLGEQLLQKAPSFLEQLMLAAAKQPDTWTKEDLHAFSYILQQPERAHASSLLYRTFLTKEFFRIRFGRYNSQQMTVPTKLLIGENDPVFSRRYSDGYTNHPQNISVEFIADCGHFIPEEKPEIVAKEIEGMF